MCEREGEGGRVSEGEREGWREGGRRERRREGVREGREGESGCVSE